MRSSCLLACCECSTLHACSAVFRILVLFISFFCVFLFFFFFFSSRRRHTRSDRDWSSDVCSSDLESDTGADRVYRVGLPQAVLASDFARTALRVLMPVGVIGAAYPPTEAGTDVGPSVEAGVPPFTLSQDASRYFEIHHTPDDTLDKIDRSQLHQNVAPWAALVWLAADSDVDFRARPGTAPQEPLR